jgi:thiosulfate/3-mercaptopyruvate sulfurtransferase
LQQQMSAAIRRKYLLNVLDVSESLADYQVLDSSWFLPSHKRDAIKEFESQHIPGAQFFDINEVANKGASTEFAPTIPSADVFADKISEFGIQNGDHVVVYDTLGLFSAARCWYMFRGFGHEDVSIIDGGLPAWKAAGLPVTTEIRDVERATYEANPFDASMIRTFEDIIANELSQKELVVDARPANVSAALILCVSE